MKIKAILSKSLLPFSVEFYLDDNYQDDLDLTDDEMKKELQAMAVETIAKYLDVHYRVLYETI